RLFFHCFQTWILLLREVWMLPKKTSNPGLTRVLPEWDLAANSSAKMYCKRKTLRHCGKKQKKLFRLYKRSSRLKNSSEAASHRNQMLQAIGKYRWTICGLLFF